MRWGGHRRALLSVVLLIGSALALTAPFSFRFAQTNFDVAVTDGELTASQADLQPYIERGASAVATYFGGFPLRHVNLHVRAVGGDRVRFGRSSPQDGGTIMLLIGSDAKAEALNSDWTLTHEMVHLAFPATKGNNHEWLGEGMATYVEPIARAQAGYLSVNEVWRQFVVYMPRGLPKAGDSGIDSAHGIGRIYWGGALFCLVADIEIRKATHNKKGLQDAFRSIMRQDGTMAWEWDINTIFETGDQATGTKVLQKLYREWRAKPVDVDLDKLWRELGVEKQGDTVVFHDDAPMAAVRKAITAKR
jgi:hypothetical protein